MDIPQARDIIALRRAAFNLIFPKSSYIIRFTAKRVCGKAAARSAKKSPPAPAFAEKGGGRKMSS